MANRIRKIGIIVLCAAVLLIGGGLLLQIVGGTKTPAQKEITTSTKSAQSRSLAILQKDFPNMTFQFVEVDKDGGYQFTSEQKPTHTKVIYTVNLETKKYTISTVTQGGESGDK